MIFICAGNGAYNRFSPAVGKIKMVALIRLPWFKFMIVYGKMFKMYWKC